MSMTIRRRRAGKARPGRPRRSAVAGPVAPVGLPAARLGPGR